MQSLEEVNDLLWILGWSGAPEVAQTRTLRSAQASGAFEVYHSSEMVPEESSVEVGGEVEPEIHVCVDEKVLVKAALEEEMFWKAPERHFAKKVKSSSICFAFDYETKSANQN